MCHLFLSFLLLAAGCGDDDGPSGTDGGPRDSGTDARVGEDAPGEDAFVPPVDGGSDAGPTCFDMVQNGDETDEDCGGTCEANCDDGLHCVSADDCTSRLCLGDTCAPPDCFNMVEDGTETDEDCGGSCEANCADGRACGSGDDCTSGVCTGMICAAPDCPDGVRNGDETDVDCGGGGCAACGDGLMCLTGADCLSRVCDSTMHCAMPACDDMVQNGGETDTDCGGPTTCPRCEIGDSCIDPADCMAGDCVGGMCELMLCMNGSLDPGETDVDCGGPCAAGCDTDEMCAVADDCTSGVCGVGGICAVAPCACIAPTCFDGVRNDDETDVDCGGSCMADCADGRTCAGSGDCASGVCGGGICRAPSCTDGVRNGMETDVDCGGAGPMPCSPCADTRMCVLPRDCMSSSCMGGTCRMATCFDMILNGTETDTDCGGTCMADCADTRMCRAASDCISGVCMGGTCRAPTCTDGVRNGMESDVDCGGGGVMPCPRCAAGRMCGGGGDCAATLSCTGGVCRAPCPPRLDPTDDGPGGASQDLVISEINPGEYIEVYNNTGSDITLAGTSYQFCSPFSYSSLSSLGPGITVPARGFALLSWPAGWSDTDAGGEVILYATGVFGDPGDVMDFVCWGVNPHGSRKSTAELAGKWAAAGPCAPALTSGAIHRRAATDGRDAADYDTASAPSPSMCAP